MTAATRYELDAETREVLVSQLDLVLAMHGADQPRLAGKLAAAALDVLDARPSACACNTTEQRTHVRGDRRFCQLGDPVTGGEGGDD